MVNKKIKKKMYFPSSFLVIFGLMILFVIISWIGQAFTNKIHGVGILDIFPNMWRGFVSKSAVILFVFSIGGILGVLTKLKVIDAGISAMVDRLGNYVFLLIPFLMFAFGLGGTTYGMWEETIAFFPVLIPVFKKAGFGPFTAVLVILMGAGVGCLASTINPFAVGLGFASASKVTIPGVKIPTGITQGIMMGSRWVIFVLFEIVAITLVMFQAMKYKRNNGNVKGIDNDLIEKTFPTTGEKLVFTVKRKISLIIFALSFLFMIIAYLPWSSWIGKDILGQWAIWWNSHLYFLWTVTTPHDPTAPWPVETTNTAGFAALGSWYFISVAAIFLMASIIIFALNFSDFVSYDENGKKTLANKEEVFISEYVTGVKDVLSVTLLIACAAGLGVILDATGIGLVIANSVSVIGKKGFILFALVIFVVSLLLSFLLPSTSGFTVSFIPIFTKIAILGFVGASNQRAAIGIVVLAFILASGIANLVTPTSAALMGYTSYAKVSYQVWLRETWKMTLTFLGVSIVVLIAVAGLAQAGITF